MKIFFCVALISVFYGFCVTARADEDDIVESYVHCGPVNDYGDRKTPVVEIQHVIQPLLENLSWLSAEFDEFSDSPVPGVVIGNGCRITQVAREGDSLAFRNPTLNCSFVVTPEGASYQLVYNDRTAQHGCKLSPEYPNFDAIVSRLSEVAY